MGDIQIPGGPFVITLPDDWTVSSHSNPDLPVLEAESPQGYTKVVYNIHAGSSLNEAVAQTTWDDLLENNCISIPLNGMDCVIFYGIYPTNIMGAAFWQAGVPSSSPSMMGTYIDFAVFFAENQGAVLQANIMTNVAGYHEYPQGANLLVISGIWPAMPGILEGIPSLIPLKESNPVKIFERYSKTKDSKRISHAGKERKVSTTRTSKFGQLPETLRQYDKLASYLGKLKEISGVLKKDMKYADYAAELIKIYRGLLELMNPTKPTRS